VGQPIEEVVPRVYCICPAAQAAVERNRPCGLELDALVVPGAQVPYHIELRNARRTLAHEAHRSTRIGITGEQRVRAAKHFDVFEIAEIWAAEHQVQGSDFWFDGTATIDVKRRDPKGTRIEVLIQ